MVQSKVEIELPRDLLAALGISDADLSRRAQEWVVLELFQEGEISSGKAGEILGLSKAAFIELLNDRRLPYLDSDSDELEREARVAEAASENRNG